MLIKLLHSPDGDFTRTLKIRRLVAFALAAVMAAYALAFLAALAYYGKKL